MGKFADRNAGPENRTRRPSVMMASAYNGKIGCKERVCCAQG